MTQVNGIAVWAEGIKAELAQRLPRQRKTQRDKLAVLVATMLRVRSANLVEMAAGLPRASDRCDMGYHWISRFLANGLVCCDEVMAPFAREILAWLAETGAPIRDGSNLGSVAVDKSGALAIAWQDSRFSGGARDGIAFSRSLDGGLTWSAPVEINSVPGSGFGAAASELALGAPGEGGVGAEDAAPGTAGACADFVVSPACRW